LNIFSAASIKILYVLALDPSRSMYQREIARAAGVSVGSANRILNRLVELGFVEKEEKGKIHLYKFKLTDPASRALKILFNILKLKPLLEELAPLTRRIILFGSCAEGMDHGESDIDLFILTEHKEKASRIIHRYEGRRHISPIIVTMTEYVKLRNENTQLYREILKGITLWERD